MYDVAVIGAGMLGAAAAYRLACAGARVLLVEALEPASGTSGNSFAWLNAVSKEPEAYHRLNADGMAEYRDLAEELGTEIGLHWSGALQWGATDEEQAALEERVRRLAARGYAAAMISRDEARAREPALAIERRTERVASFPGDGWIDAPRLVRALVNRALAEGADLWRGAPVLALRRQQGGVTAVETDRDTAEAGRVLLCAGTRTADLPAPLGVSLPIERVPGLLAITSPVTQRPSGVIHAPGVHLRPDVDGGLRIGADDIDALIDEDTPPEPPPVCAQRLLERARTVVPAARDAEIVRVHVGIRPMPVDGHTVAGPLPGLSNVWVLVTHSGITLGPLLGRLMAQEITSGEMDPRLAPFRPDRFADLTPRPPSLRGKGES